MKRKPIFYHGAPEVETIIGRPDVDWHSVKFTRVWAMPNHQTFKIVPIKKLLDRYIPPTKNNEWVDPFSGANSPAELKNDHNPDMPVKYHMEAIKFAHEFRMCKFKGIIFDPPYSFRQISEHYKSIGQKANKLHTSMAFYEKAKSAFCELIEVGGYAISCGWNTNGFGRARGFEIVEILIVAHGGSKNDTIVVVEKKVK